MREAGTAAVLSRLRLVPGVSGVHLDVYTQKLHTRQYAGLLPASRRERIKVTRNHTFRAVAAVGIVGMAAWCGAGIGSGIAHADTNHEREACALMDDSASARHNGYGNSTFSYAFAVLSREMPSEEAGHVLLAATRDDCPNHAADVPAGWI